MTDEEMAIIAMQLDNYLRWLESGMPQGMSSPLTAEPIRPRESRLARLAAKLRKRSDKISTEEST